MDPNQFYLDFERVGEVLLSIIVLALLLERALSVPFENRWFMSRVLYKIKRAKDLPSFNDQTDTHPDKIISATPRFGAAKELITIGLSFAICLFWKFDAFSFLMPVSQTKDTWFGELLTAMIIAGGSKGAIKLFSDWLQIKSSAQVEIDAARARRPKKNKA